MDGSTQTNSSCCIWTISSPILFIALWVTKRVALTPTQTVACSLCPHPTQSSNLPTLMRFMEKLLKHKIMDTFMGFLEAVADKGVYKKFAKAYMAAETFSRRAKAMAAMYKSFQLQTK